jgi:hypothetical protein
MPLDPAVLRKAEAWISTRCPLIGKTCPCCGGGTLGFGEFSSLVRMPGQGLLPGTPPDSAAVVLPYFCGDCGFVRLFSPVVMGITPPA